MAEPPARRAEIRRTGVQLVSRPRCGGYDDVVDVASGAARVEEAPARGVPVCRGPWPPAIGTAMSRVLAKRLRA